MSAGALLLTSDVHARYDVIDRQTEHAEHTFGLRVSQVLVLGDFGFFDDEMHDFFRRRRREFLRPVAAIEGNHEDHAALPDLARRYSDVITHLPRARLHRADAWGALCLGGAKYMDAASTPRGCEITEADVAACLAHDADDVDLILTHDCPADIGVPNTPGLEHYGPPGVGLMSPLAERFRPRWWFFGHHHRWFETELGGTRYVGLPQSWHGYALLHGDGRLETVDHSLDLHGRPWWRRLFGK